MESNGDTRETVRVHTVELAHLEKRLDQQGEAIQGLTRAVYGYQADLMQRELRRPCDVHAERLTALRKDVDAVTLQGRLWNGLNSIGAMIAAVLGVKQP